MGKKRRVLHSSKFATLREHPKYKGLVRANSKSSGNRQEIEEIEEPEVVAETPVLKTNKEVETSETEIAKPKPPKAPKTKKSSPKVSAKKIDAPKKPTARRKTSKKVTIKAP